MKIETALREKISKDLCPSHFELYNDSALHSRDPQGETHFRAVIVAEAFAGLSRVARSQLVDQGIAEIRKQTGLHSFSMRCLTPQEWEQNMKKSTPILCAHNPKSES